MNSAALMGRIGPMAFAMAVGAGIVVGGTGIAAADSGGPGAARASAEKSAHSARKAAATGADATRPSPAARSARPAARHSAPRAQAVGGSGIAALLNNTTPALRPIQTGQTGGVVRGELSAADPDSDRLVYTVTRDPEYGTVEVADDGSYVYTADAADPVVTDALATTGITDGFEVRVTDAQSGFHLHGLLGLLNLITFGLIGSSGHIASATVPVTLAAFAGANRAPTASVRVGEPDPVSGVVTGAVLGVDPDGDVLSYTAPSATAKGTISLDGLTGVFTYTPTTIARQNAAASTATAADRQDAFTATVSDGRGAAIPVTVTVAIPADGGTSGTLTAFPGAEGFGAYATGGRDGRVIYVTTLDADGPGSLQWAIDQPGAKYILFKVSGLIDTQIHLTNGDVTIAGQTSPGGITIRGFVTDETPFQDQAVRAPVDFAENWILQHIRIRPVSDSVSDDGLRIRYTRNAIVDHVSIGNALDEAIEISYSHDITVQNTIIAETVGGHSFYGGVLMNYSNPAYGFALDDVSLHHNIFNRIEGRLPEGSRESLAAANSTMSLELSNNLYWDPNFFIALGANTGVVTGSGGEPYPIYWKINAVNNVFRTRAGFPYGMFDDQILRNASNQLYVSGNAMSAYPGRSDYQLFYCCNDYPSVTPNTAGQAATKLTTRLPFPSITYTPTDQLRTVLLNTAGAWPRDPMDQRLLQSVATDSIASAPRNTNPAGDALTPVLTSPPAPPADTDNDGMPDAWEIARGLDATVANANARTLSSIGYTDLEVYLQELSASRVTGWV